MSIAAGFAVAIVLYLAVEHELPGHSGIAGLAALIGGFLTAAILFAREQENARLARRATEAETQLTVARDPYFACINCSRFVVGSEAPTGTCPACGGRVRPKEPRLGLDFDLDEVAAFVCSECDEDFEAHTVHLVPGGPAVLPRNAHHCPECGGLGVQASAPGRNVSASAQAVPGNGYRDDVSGVEGKTNGGLSDDDVDELFGISGEADDDEIDPLDPLTF